MRRICVFGMSDNLGGTEVYLITLYRVLREKKADLQFDFLLNHNSGVIPFEAEIIEKGGRIFREYYTRREKQAPGFLDIPAVFARHPDWCGVYLNVQNIHTAYRLIEEAAKRRWPYRIIHVHNNGYERKPTIRERLYEYYFHATVHQNATSLLACSEESGRWMYGRESFTVIPDAVPFEHFRMNEALRNKIRGNLSIGENTTVLGFCGRLTDQKNPLFLIDVFACFRKLQPESRLLIVGGGELEPRIRERIKKRGMESKVILVGNQPDVNPYLQAMDCFVLPSRYEGFGIALLEAQAAGLRCYTTAKAVPREADQTGRVTFISASEPPSVWAGRIFDEKSERRDCYERLIKSPYSTDALYAEFMKVIRE